MSLADPGEPVQMARNTCRQEQGAGGHIVSADRKRRKMNAGAHPPLIFNQGAQSIAVPPYLV